MPIVRHPLLMIHNTFNRNSGSYGTTWRAGIPAPAFLIIYEYKPSAWQGSISPVRCGWNGRVKRKRGNNKGVIGKFGRNILKLENNAEANEECYHTQREISKTFPLPSLLGWQTHSHQCLGWPPLPHPPSGWPLWQIWGTGSLVPVGVISLCKRGIWRGGNNIGS